MGKISPTSDLAFKKVLSSEENKDILAGLIRDFHFFAVNPEDITLENPYSIDVFKEEINKKLEQSVLRYTSPDIASSFESSEYVSATVKRIDFISEMQIHKTRHYEKRFLYYAFKKFCQNYGIGDLTSHGSKVSPYSTLRPVCSLNIVSQNHFDDEEALRIFELYDPIRRKMYPGNIVKIGFFELSKPKVETENQKHWRDYFNTGNISESAPSYIKKASGIIDFVNLTEEEREMSYATERAEALWIEEIDTAFSNGEYKHKKETAKAMIADGFTTDQIIKYSGLDVDEVKRMQLGE